MRFFDCFIEVELLKPWKGDIRLGLFTVEAEGPNKELYNSFNISLLFIELGFYRKQK